MQSVYVSFTYHDFLNLKIFLGSEQLIFVYWNSLVRVQHTKCNQSPLYILTTVSTETTELSLNRSEINDAKFLFH